jgi:ligand-binding SRPBCC domain-containing protein
MRYAKMQSQFIYSSIIPAPLEKVWALYAEVNSINKISPFFARVNFERVDLPLRAGSEIIFVGKYPPRLRWHAKIEAFVPNSHFVDMPVAGPFAEWRHEHIFKSRGETTEMIDQVTFCMKNGRVLNMLFAPLLKLLLRVYFSYRHRRTRQLLAG